jgi:hypothetical protein
MACRLLPEKNDAQPVAACIGLGLAASGIFGPAGAEDGLYPAKDIGLLQRVALVLQGLQD